MDNLPNISFLKIPLFLTTDELGNGSNESKVFSIPDEPTLQRNPFLILNGHNKINGDCVPDPSKNITNGHTKDFVFNNKHPFVLRTHGNRTSCVMHTESNVKKILNPDISADQKKLFREKLNKQFREKMKQKYQNANKTYGINSNFRKPLQQNFINTQTPNNKDISLNASKPQKQPAKKIKVKYLKATQPVNIGSNLQQPLRQNFIKSAKIIPNPQGNSSTQNSIGTQEVSSDIQSGSRTANVIFKEIQKAFSETVTMPYLVDSKTIAEMCINPDKHKGTLEMYEDSEFIVNVPLLKSKQPSWMSSEKHTAFRAQHTRSVSKCFWELSKLLNASNSNTKEAIEFLTKKFPEPIDTSNPISCVNTNEDYDDDKNKTTLFTGLSKKGPSLTKGSKAEIGELIKEYYQVKNQ